MKILINALTILVAAGVGLAVGFAWRGKVGSLPVAANSRGVASAPRSTSTSAIPRPAGGIKMVRARDDSPLATQLEIDLSMSSGVVRWLYWLEAMEKAALADFPRLARLAHGNATAARLLAAQWIELSPRHLFDTIVAAKDGHGFPVSELTSALFAEWPKRDAEAVIAALSETNGFGARNNWRMNIAGSIIERDAERGLRLMSEWHIDNYGPRMTGVAKWAAANPRHAAEVALANPAGYASQLVMETIGKEWARTDPAAALGFAAGKPGQLGSALAAAVLKHWAARNLDGAAGWLAGTDPLTCNRLSPALVESWAKFDANAALAWCEANLAGSSLKYAVGGVLKGAAESDVIGAAELVAGMKPSSARAEAAVAVAQKWFPEGHSAKPMPPEAVEWVAGLDESSVARVLDQCHWRWAESDPKSLAAFLASSGGEKVPDHVCSNLARNMARQNPSETLEWASRLPESRGLSVGGEAFAEWRRLQPEPAMKWLNDLPASDPRRASFLQKTIRSLVYEPHAAEQLAAMSTIERAAARDVIGQMNLPTDRRDKLLQALQAR